MEKETLEEAKLRIIDSNYVTVNDGDIFEMGAKWQSERMYSEEEVIDLLHKRMIHTLGDDYQEKTTTKWFEQFKKK
jgi:hypothetical protein